MSLAYLLPQEQLSFEELLSNMDVNSDQALAEAQNLEALFGSALGATPLHHPLAAMDQDFLAAALHGQVHQGLDLASFVAPGALAGDYMSDVASYASGPDSPAESVVSHESANAQANPFAALVIPSDRTGLPLQPVQPFQLFPPVAQPQAPLSPPAEPKKSPARGAKAPARPPAKRPVRGPSVSWQAAASVRAPSTGVPVQPFSPVIQSMPSPPLSPSVSVKDEAAACAPPPTTMAPARTPSGGIKTPFDDMADEDLDDLDEEEIMGMMGKVAPKAGSTDGKEKKKRKRRTTAELAPQELEVRRIKNSEAARRCRLRKTLKLRWLEARCTELEETNAKLTSRLADLEARLA